MAIILGTMLGEEHRGILVGTAGDSHERLIGCIECSRAFALRPPGPTDTPGEAPAARGGPAAPRDRRGPACAGADVCGKLRNCSIGERYCWFGVEAITGTLLAGSSRKPAVGVDKGRARCGCWFVLRANRISPAVSDGDAPVSDGAAARYSLS